MMKITAINPSGPVANTTTLQVAAACRNIRRLETMATDVPWQPHDLRHYTGALTDIRPSNASATFHS